MYLQITWGKEKGFKKNRNIPDSTITENPQKHLFTLKCIQKQEKLLIKLICLAELDDLADFLGVTLLLDELNKLHDTIGNKLVTDRLVLGEHLAELVKKVDDLLLGVRILDVVLKSINDELADRAAGLRLEFSGAHLDHLANLLGLHGLDVLDDLLELTVKKRSADISILGTNIAAELGDELLDFLVGLTLIQPVINKRDNSLAGSALDIISVSHGNSADGGEKKSNKDGLHYYY